LGKQILVEPDLCTGCMICAQVCSLTKTRTCNPARARVRIVDCERTGVTVPVVCQDCVEPGCLSCCPPAAIRQDQASGLVSIDRESCTNCRICMRVCPFGGPTWDPVERQVHLCDHCDGRPACVASCPTGALTYVEAGEDTCGARQRSLGEIRLALIRWAGA